MSLKPEMEILSLCLKINLLNVFDNLVMLKKLLVLYGKSSRRTMKTRLQYFHLQELYKAKIDAFYNYKMDLGDNKQEASLNNQYYILLQQCNQQVTRRFFDISIPLQHKNFYLQLHESISEVSQVRLQVYTSLQAAREQRSSIDIKVLAKMNRQCQKKVKEIDYSIENVFMTMKLPPSYYFSLL